jgi:hypothetical protein
VGKWTRILAPFIALSVPVACKSLGDLVSLQTELRNQFHMSAPGVELRNSRVLLLGIEDSQFVAMDSVTRELRAGSMAVLVRAKYSGFSRLSAITIGFVRLSKAGAVTVRTPYFVKSFRVPDLAPIQPVFQ